MNSKILVASALFYSAVQGTLVVSEEMNAHIRSKTTKWVPMDVESNPFKDQPRSKLHKMLGEMSPDPTTSAVETDIIKFMKNHSSWIPSWLKPSPLTKSSSHPDLYAPATFDARTQWGTCIHDVRDQQYCGSCWAFGAAGFLEDRLCIDSNGEIDVILSPQYLVSCSFENIGCGGGWQTTSIDFLMSDGLPTETCLPYTSENDFCTNTCTTKGEKFQKYYCKRGTMKILNTVEEIKAEVYNNGPVSTFISIYADFYSYSTGTYEVTTTTFEGGHVVKLIGWDNDGFDDYWIIQNQWGTSWGQSGYGNIKFGEAGVDYQAVACAPEV